MTNPTLPNADELEVVATAWKFYDTQCVDLKFAPDPWHLEHGHLTNVEPLVTLSSAQAQIERLASERDEAIAKNAVLNADGIAARKAAANNYDRAEAAKAEVKRLRLTISNLSVMRDRWNESLDEDAFEALGAAMDEAILTALSGGTRNG